MKTHTHNIIIRFATALLILSVVSCSPSRKLQRNRYVLNKIKVKIDNPNIDINNIYSFIQQYPNKKLFGVFRFNSWVYESASRGKKTKLKKWLKNKIGEKPAILNPFLTNNSIKHIKLYLNNKGYFNSIVSKEIKLKKRNKIANLTYVIRTSKPYTIRNIFYSVNDSSLKSFVLYDKLNSLIKSGHNYDAKLLDDERDRITDNLKNNGYYYFSKEFIHYQIDSSLNKHQLDISIKIENPYFKSEKNPDKYIEGKHKRYNINKIYIYPCYNPLNAKSVKYDTLTVKLNPLSHSASPVIYHFLYKNKLRIKPQTITQSVFFKQGDYFNLKNVNLTQRHLSDLGFTKFVSIEFEKAKGDSSKTKLNKNLLNSKIKITRKPVNSFSIETDGTNSAGNYGIAGNFIYQNRNLFRGGEAFRLKIRGAMEMKQWHSTELTEEKFLFFNTFETGVEASLVIPKFLIPVKAERFPKTFNPKTTFIGGYNYQKRKDFTRYIANLSFGYKWKASQTARHIFYPVVFNSVKIYKSSDFENKLQGFDKKYQEQYTNHLIAALKYSFIFNNQSIKKLQNFNYLRLNFESSGNLFSFIYHAAKIKKDENGNYTLFNLRYSQYIRTDIDFRHYHIFNKNNTFVYRTVFGLGIPYGNSKVLPFEKSFYVGGANGMRGWQIRSLGPGAYKDTSGIRYNNIGDILMEGNFEYRYPIYKILKGAFFVDAGNVWLLNESNDFPKGKFKLNNFFSQIAFDAGFGFRFDFKYFILRIDGATALKIPSLPENHRWINPDKLSLPDIIWNFGIGYPF